MSGQLLAMVAQFLTPEVIDAMAAQAHIDPASARKAAELGVPAILSGLAEFELRANGVARLRSAIAKLPSNPGETGRVSLPPQQGGASLITDFFGAESAEVLACGIGRFVGASKSSTHAFLDGLASAVLAAVAGQARQANADDKDLANLLRAEQEPAAAALPIGLSNLLRSNGFYKNLGRPTPAGLCGGQAPASLTGSSVAAAAAGAHARWAYLALPLAALVAGVAYFHANAINPWVGPGGSHVVVSPLGDPRAQPAMTANQTGATYPGSAVSNAAAEKRGTLTELVAAADARVRAALLSLARFLGTGEEGHAVALVDLQRRQDNERGDERRLVDVATDELTRAAAGVSRQRLRFVSPGFKDLMAQGVPDAIERPAGAQTQ
jgi:Bacterial protein of unknown function (DUF937)